MKILGINISHNASIAYYNNTLISYYEEDRFNRIKNWEPTDINNCEYKCIKEKINFKPDIVVYASYDKSIKNYYGKLDVISDQHIIHKLQKQLNHPDYFFNSNFHHVYHALCGFYFSPFKEAVCIVMDGGGAQSLSTGYQEMDSIYLVNKDSINLKYQKFSNLRYMIAPKHIEAYSNLEVKGNFNGTDVVFNSKSNPPYRFSSTSEQIFNDSFAAGKVMGLAAYKKGGKRNLKKEDINKSYNLQKYSLKYTIELIKKVKKYTDIKNIVLSGGYFLNCLNNYKYVQLFKEYNFFVDPIAHDGGTAIGSCIYYNDYYKQK